MKAKTLSKRVVLNSIHSKPYPINNFKSNNKIWLNETFKLDLMVATTEAPFRVSSNYNITASTSKQEGLTSIANLYLPLLKYLRFIGFCPLEIHEDPDSLEPVFEFKWRTWKTLFSAVVILIFGVLSFLAVCYNLYHGFSYDFGEVLKRQGIHDEGYKNISFVSEFGTRLLPASYPFFSVSATFGILSSLPGILELMQRWPLFQKQYMEYFPHRKNDDPFKPLKDYRNSKFLIFPIAGLGASVFVSWIMLDCEYWKGCMFPQTYFGVPTILATYTMMTMIGGHTVHLFLYRTLRETLHQIKVGIQLWIEMETGKNVGNHHWRKSLIQNIRNWKKIITFAKEQVVITSKAVAMQHILMIFINFIYLCLGVFASISSKIGSSEGSRGYMLLMFASWGFALLITKAFMCENIAEQV